MTAKQKNGAHKPAELQAIATEAGGIAPPRPRDIGKIVGLNVRPISFRGLSAIFWKPPAFRPWPIFPLGGETPVEITESGGVGLVDEKRKKIVIFKTLGAGHVCDMSSVSDVASRLTGIRKSDLMPQGIFHDTAYRFGKQRIAWQYPFSACGDKGDVADAAKILRHTATNHPFEDFGYAGSKEGWHEFSPDQEWADDLFRCLLMNFNHEVLPDSKGLLSWLAVRFFGKGSFRDKKMAAKCDKIAKKIDDYCHEMGE